jgi:hypothetical protein
MASNLFISVSKGRMGPDVNVNVNDLLEETDIEELLKFDSERIMEYYPSHASVQAYWEELANKLREDYENFKNIDFRKWWSHSRFYARLILSSLGDKKPTNDAINDMVISVFSADSSQNLRDKYCEFAYKSSQSSKGLFSDDYEVFKGEMFKYVNCEIPVTFEEIERISISLERGYDAVKIIADRLNSRSFHMQEVAKFLHMKMGNSEMNFRSGQAIHHPINGR